MTAYALQKELGMEVEAILSDMLFKDVNGSQTNIKSYMQNLPKREQSIYVGGVMPIESMMEDEKDLYPHCIIKLDSGFLESAQSAHEIKTFLIFGIFDDDMNCQGHQAILNIIQKIIERFTKNPVLNDRYRMNYEAGISWVLDDEDRYPYYFGALEMTWDIACVRREDKYA